MKAIDLFAGAGGTTTGAKQAGVDVLWAANHNEVAVRFHEANHPEVNHLLQDLHQADWALLPDHDLVLASPCCQGHANAAGKMKKSKKADTSRSTAWAVVSCIEAHRAPVAIIENVPEFLEWELYPIWESAMKTMGYSLSINYVNANTLGIPQNRLRVFIVATRSKNPIHLKLESEPFVPARTIIDLNENGYKWDLVSNRVPATQLRVKNGRKKYGEILLDAAYGSSRCSRSIDAPIGVITCINKHSLVIGDKIRSLSIKELAAAQSFSEDYLWPKSAVATKRLLGNAVPPTMAEKVIRAVLQAA